MPRYIDAEKMQSLLEEEIEGCGYPISENKPIAYGTTLGLKMALSYAKTLPTADVAPVVHAHWEYHECVCTDEGRTGVFVCSACKVAVPEAVFDFLMDGFYKDFCGACGAKMDEEAKENES